MKTRTECKRTKQNNEHRNVVGDLGGFLEVLEGNDKMSEVLGVCQNLGEW